VEDALVKVLVLTMHGLMCHGEDPSFRIGKPPAGICPYERSKTSKNLAMLRLQDVQCIGDPIAEPVEIRRPEAIPASLVNQLEREEGPVEALIKNAHVFLVLNQRVIGIDPLQQEMLGINEEQIHLAFFLGGVEPKVLIELPQEFGEFLS
jgi:hypothetical protein